MPDHLPSRQKAPEVALMNYLPNNHREILIAIQKHNYRHCRDGPTLQYSQEGGQGGEVGDTASVFRSSHTAHSDTTGTDHTHRLCTQIINYTPY